MFNKIKQCIISEHRPRNKGNKQLRTVHISAGRGEKYDQGGEHSRLHLTYNIK